jgi:hypothetical protein
VTVAGPVLVLVAFGLALFFLSQPFWPGHVEKVAERDDLRRADLEAAKIAKYREIRDTELDHATGKLSDADWRPIDARLRAEAVRILDELDGLGGDTRAPRTDDLPVAPADPAADDAAPPVVAGGTPGADAPSAGTADAAPTR